MNAFFIEIPYVLVPLMITLLCRKMRFLPRENTHLITGILIFIYPLLLFWLQNIFNPLIPGPLLNDYQLIYFLTNLFFFLPLTLLLQMIFNEIILKKKEEEWNELE